MKHFIMVIAISIFCLMAHVVDAYDFYGASVSDRDVPSSYMKYGLKGLIGYRPTITGVSYDSTADKAGFKRGDIFLSINDKVVKSTSDLGPFTGPTISVNLFRGLERITLTIDRLAIETEKASRIAGEKKSPEDERKTGNSAPPSFDGAVLEKKMLKPLPAALASKKQPTETDRKIEEIDKKNEKTSLEKKKYEWDIVSFTHFPNLVENVVLRGDMVNLKTNELCTTPHSVQAEHCVVKFENGSVSKLECGNSYNDLAEIPDNTVKNAIRVSLREQCCTGQVKNLNAPVACGVSY